MVEEMLAARGICVTYETVRQWATKFGETIADQIRQRAPPRGDKWHMDEVERPRRRSISCSALIDRSRP
jgi:putative transposase